MRVTSHQGTRRSGAQCAPFWIALNSFFTRHISFVFAKGSFVGNKVHIAVSAFFQGACPGGLLIHPCDRSL